MSNKKNKRLKIQFNRAEVEGAFAGFNAKDLAEKAAASLSVVQDQHGVDDRLIGQNVAQDVLRAMTGERTSAFEQTETGISKHIPPVDINALKQQLETLQSQIAGWVAKMEALGLESDALMDRLRQHQTDIATLPLYPPTDHPADYAQKVDAIRIALEQTLADLNVREKEIVAERKRSLVKPEALQAFPQKMGVSEITELSSEQIAAEYERITDTAYIVTLVEENIKPLLERQHGPGFDRAQELEKLNAQLGESLAARLQLLNGLVEEKERVSAQELEIGTRGMLMMLEYELTALSPLSERYQRAVAAAQAVIDAQMPKTPAATRAQFALELVRNDETLQQLIMKEREEFEQELLNAIQEEYEQNASKS